MNVLISINQCKILKIMNIEGFSDKTNLESIDEFRKEHKKYATRSTIVTKFKVIKDSVELQKIIDTSDIVIGTESQRDLLFELYRVDSFIIRGCSTIDFDSIDGPDVLNSRDMLKNSK